MQTKKCKRTTGDAINPNGFQNKREKNSESKTELKDVNK